MRNNISGFVQQPSESIYDAWACFKQYQVQCPHHGYTEQALLSRFHFGLLPKFRILLDTTSHGNFLHLDVTAGCALIENLAQAAERYGDDFDGPPAKQTESELQCRVLAKLSDQLDMLLTRRVKKAHSIIDRGKPQDSITATVEEVSYIQKQVPEQTCTYRLQIPHSKDVYQMLEQILHGQQTSVAALNHKIIKVSTRVEESHINLIGKFEALDARLTMVEQKHAVNAAACQTLLATMPCLKHNTKAITLKGGSSLIVKAGDDSDNEDSIIQEGGDSSGRENNANSIPTPKLASPTRQLPQPTDPSSSQNPSVSTKILKTFRPATSKTYAAIP